MRARAPVSLNVIRVAQPCPADWNSMHGDDRVRFCDECKLRVYNLSSLTRVQAERLVAQHEGRLCVRYYQRADGTVITQDCGGGLRRAMQRTRRVVTLVAGTLLCAIVAPFTFGMGSSKLLKIDRTETELPAPQDRQFQGKVAIMGDVALPPRQQPVVMGIVAPRPPATQPTTAPATQPATPDDSN